MTSWQEWLSETRPLVTPTISITNRGSTTSSPSSSSSSSSLLREVVLGASDLGGMATALNGVGEPVAGRPNCFWLRPGSLALRLLPSPMSALVLRAPGKALGQVQEELGRRGLVRARPIGQTGASAGQLLLQAPELDGLDIRICGHQGEDLPGVFAEGEEVLRENVLDELNPAIDVQPVEEEGGLAASVPAAQYRRMSNGGSGVGDCWSEFRATVRRPSGWLKK